MASILERFRDMLRRRTHGGVDGNEGRLGEGQKPSRYEKALEEFAEMHLVIGSNFGIGYELIEYMYDRRRHRYHPAYIHDSTPMLYLSAQPGLQRYESTLLPGGPPVPRRGAAIPNPGDAARPGGRIAAEVETIARRIPTLEEEAAAGRAGGGVLAPLNPSGLLSPPDYLLAYDWVISSKSTGWSKHLIVQRKAKDLARK